MRARKFLGNYLAQEDVLEPTVVTIESAEEVRFDDDPKAKLSLHFKEFDKNFICNATNINLLIALYGTDDTDEWIGKKATLYVDPDVTFGGKKIGGLRVRSANPENF